MSANYKYVSIDRIFSKVIRDFKGDFSEIDVVEWCGEALEFIGASKYYEEKVAFVEVKNYQCLVPSKTHSIIQIARDNKWSGSTEDSLCPIQVVNEKNPLDTPSPDVPIVLDCDGRPLELVNYAYYRPYYDLKWESNGWLSSNVYTRRFTPVRLSTSELYQTLVCMSGVNNYGTDEYTIIKGEVIRFNFEKGSVAIAYNSQVVDSETGYPMIPDQISYVTAITKYITMKVMEKEFYTGREGSGGRLQKAESDWQWYCKQASNVDKMPSTPDEYQNIMNQMSHLLPKRNSYYGFFGNLNKAENRTFNNPDRRNKSSLYYGTRNIQ